MKEGAPLRNFQFMSSPELEMPQQWVISSHGSEVTSKTESCSRPEQLLTALGGHPNCSRHFAESGTLQAVVWPVHKPRCGSLLARWYFPAPRVAAAAPCLAGCPASRGMEGTARLLCQKRSITSSSSALLGNLITNLRIWQTDIGNPATAASFKELFISVPKKLQLTSFWKENKHRLKQPNNVSLQTFNSKT